MNDNDPCQSGKAVDRLLPARIAAGDRSAFQLFYQQHWQLVYNTALHFLKSPEHAQDIVQDVFCKLWVNREKLLLVQQPAAYMYTTARNEIFTALKKKAAVVADISPYSESLVSTALQPDHLLDIKESEAVILAAVEQLPSQQKLVFQLTRQHGLSHDEVASHLGLTRQTVGNHITRALTAIRKQLQLHADSTLLIGLAIVRLLKKN